MNEKELMNRVLHQTMNLIFQEYPVSSVEDDFTSVQKLGVGEANERLMKQLST